MADFQNKNRKNFWYSPIALFGLLCVVLIFIYNMIGVIDKTRDTAKKRDLVFEEVETLNKREAMLTAEIGRLNTEVGAEEAIREKYQLVKEGEKIVVIVDEENQNGENIEVKEKSKFRLFFERLFR